MSLTIEATYENGVLKPAQPLPLNEHESVRVTVHTAENQQPSPDRVEKRPARQPRPAPGLGKGSVVYMSPDFDAPMEEFNEYTE